MDAHMPEIDAPAGSTGYTDEEIYAHRVAWIHALESGNYEQVRGALAYAEDEPARGEETKILGHCCLGVACEVAIKDGLDIRTEVTIDGSNNEGASPWIKVYDEARGELPESVRLWLGLASTDPYFRGWDKDADHYTQFALSGWNDTKRLPFPEIAIMLRGQWSITE